MTNGRKLEIRKYFRPGSLIAKVPKQFHSQRNIMSGPTGRSPSDPSCSSNVFGDLAVPAMERWLKTLPEKMGSIIYRWSKPNRIKVSGGLPLPGAPATLPLDLSIAAQGKMCKCAD